jgi:hypothetical protein
MGVGIGLRSAPLSEKAANEKLAEIAESAKRAFDDRELNKRVRVFLSQNQLFLRFLSGEEDVEISYPDDRLVLNAKTSSLGPDEAGFASSQDFGELQGEMVLQLKGIAKAVLEAPTGAKNFRLNTEVDFPFPVDEFYAMHPLGFLSREWFERVHAAEGDDARNLASEFYAWWVDGEDGAFWFRLGLQRLWSATAWHVPQSKEEAAEMWFTLQCFDRARSLGSDAAFPEREINELNEFLKPEAEERAPEATGIGFLRRDVLHQTNGGWQIQLPGYYHQAIEDDGRTQTFWFKDRTVRVSSMTVRQKDGSKRSADSMLSLKDVNVAECELYEKDHLKGWASFEKVKDDSGEYLQLTGRMAAVNALCLVSVCISNEADREWALGVWRSAYYALQK